MPNAPKKILTKLKEFNPVSCSLPQAIGALGSIRAIEPYEERLSVTSTLIRRFRDLRVHLLHIEVLISHGDFINAIKHFRSANGSFKTHPVWIYNFAYCLKELGQFDEALKYFMQIKGEQNVGVRAMEHIAIIYDSSNQFEKAYIYYQDILAVDPENENAKVRVSAIANRTLHSDHETHVQKLFDDFAPKFDQSLIVDLGYRVPQVVMKRLDQCGIVTDRAQVLDLGCGTGALGREIGAKVSLTGVDISRNMLNEVKPNCYDELVHGDVIDFLHNTQNVFDLIFCLDVLVYVRDFDALAYQVHNKLSVGGHYIFSIELCFSDTKITPQGRVQHSIEFVTKNMIKNEMDFVSVDFHAIRMELGKPLYGCIFIFKKK